MTNDVFWFLLVVADCLAIAFDQTILRSRSLE